MFFSLNVTMKHKLNCPFMAHSWCWWAWVGLVGWREQCRPEAWAVRGKASMPEAPLERGGIATNVSGVVVVAIFKTDKLY